MAIRKFRKHMKPFIWFVTIAFVVSTAIIGIMSFNDMHGRLNNYAFKLNGDKVQRVEVERTKSNLDRNYSKYLGPNLDRDMIETLAFNDVVNKKLTLEIADELHVSVSNSEINAQFNAVKKSINNKEQFKRMLAAQGFTKTTFKADIEENLLVQKTFAKIANSINPTPQELKKYYDENKEIAYAGEPFDKVEESVKKSYIQIHTMDKYFTLLAEKKAKMELTDVDKNYQKDLPKNEISKDGFVVTNADMIQKTIAFMLKKEPKEQAIQDAKNYYDKEIDILVKLKNMGIVVNDKLPIDFQISEYQKKYLAKLKSEINPTTDELKAYFEKNKENYDILPTAKVDIALLTVSPSQKDDEIAKNKAEDILKQANHKNFKDLAHKYSMGPTAKVGGDLGWFTKERMVPEFSKAVFNAKPHTIISNVVKTKFGYHIIYVDDIRDNRAHASHILIRPVATQKEITNATDEAIKLLDTKKATFTTLKDVDKNVKVSGEFSIDNQGFIQGLGYYENLTKDIFKAPLDTIKAFKKDNKIFIFKKLDEKPARQANFETDKSQILEDYKNEMAQTELEKMFN